MKTILFIQGSPRRHGNTNKVLSMIKDLLKDDYQVKYIDINDYQINGCMGCGCCQNSDKFECIQKDDGNQLLSLLMNSDVILYGTPLYGHNYSGQLKIFLDRHVPLMKFSDNEESVENMQIISALEGKKVGLIITCQGPKENNCELIEALFDMYAKSTLTRSIGTYVFPFTNNNPDETYIDMETINNLISKI